jgi:hypothetical protein
MHNIHDIKSIRNQNVFKSKCNVNGGTRNTKFYVINQHKNDTCHMQSLGKDFYLGTIGSFDCVLIL